ncbi:MAG: undecaprenyl diphosphate synthase family protein, partial [Clostridiales bacterium]|nr:undecaprenyl diphosphate synthase family protein [Clostridiales bacterium]
MKRYTGQEIKSMGLTLDLPRHVGIIMDGNGRWASARLMPRPMGHRAGMDALREVIRVSANLGLQALTLYA